MAKWPSFPLPFKRADFRKLYNHFNRTIFDDELPEDIQLVRSKALTSAGRASLKIDPSTGTKYKIILGQSVMSSEEHIVNVLLHEMIHILMYVRYVRTNDTKWRNADHGPLFVREMDRINAKGFNVPLIEDDFGVEALSYKVRFVLLHCGMVGVKGTPCVAFQHKKPITETQMEALILRVSSTLSGTVKKAIAYETEHSGALKLDHLTVHNEVKASKKKITAYTDEFRKSLEAEATALITLDNNSGTRSRWVTRFAKTITPKIHAIEKQIYFGVVCTFAHKFTKNKELLRIEKLMVPDEAKLEKGLAQLKEQLGEADFDFLNQLYLGPDTKKIFRTYRGHAIKDLEELEELVVEQGKTVQQALRDKQIQGRQTTVRMLLLSRIPLPEVKAYFMQLGLKNTLFPRDQLNTVLKHFLK